jgi:hypothetical protein
MRRLLIGAFYSIPLLLSCQSPVRHYPPVDYDESGRILSEREWAAKYHPNLASREYVSNRELEMLYRGYDSYVRRRTIELEMELRRQELEVKARTFEGKNPEKAPTTPPG